MSPAARSSHGARKARRAKPRGSGRRSGLRALALTIVAALLPGTGYLAAGRTRLGLAVTGISVTLVGTGLYVAAARRDDVIRLAVDPDLLLAATAVLLLVALGWIGVVVSSYRLLRPAGAGGRAAGAVVVGLMAFAITAGSALGTQNLMAQRELVRHVFADGSSRSATRPKVDRKDPWATLPRLNLLLLGADDGPGRDGARADTVIVASIDTRTGDTALISLTRNFMRMPFPEGTRLHAKYPTGYWDPSRGKGSRRSTTWRRCTATFRGSTTGSSGRPTTRARTPSSCPSVRRSGCGCTTTCR